eukprot:TRINITY_DN2056_c0_g1_i7.p1 TRINITY_DN2056_c0_g1~~TRINITY_DN2056_c0_g1_i7.p1  ORF type:complete len:342 (-),score=48.24 TRINITY_DN2056_c0_g1_i7:539-1564(-)
MLDGIVNLLKAIFCQLVVVLYIGPKYLLKEHVFDRHRAPTLPKTNDQKTVLITGGSKGVGLGAVKVFLKLNCDVIIGCRNVSHAQREVEKLSGGDDNVMKRVKIFPLDLSSLESVANFAQSVRELGVNIDVLVNNAGIMKASPRTETSHGFEAHFGCNYLGHVLLTDLLYRQLLEASDKSGVCSRIVNVSSSVHTLCALMDGLQDVHLKEFYCPELAYSNSKTALLMFSQSLEHKFRTAGTNIKVISLHPGVVYTDLALQDHPRIVREFTKLIFKSADEAGETLVHAALAPELEHENLAGLYLENSLLVDIGDYCKNEKNQTKLWNETKNLLKLDEICAFM